MKLKSKKIHETLDADKVNPEWQVPIYAPRAARPPSHREGPGSGNYPEYISYAKPTTSHGKPINSNHRKAASAFLYHVLPCRGLALLSHVFQGNLRR